MTPFRVAFLLAVSLLAWEFWDIKKNKVDGGRRVASRRATAAAPPPVVGPRCLR